MASVEPVGGILTGLFCVVEEDKANYDAGERAIVIWGQRVKV